MDSPGVSAWERKMFLSVSDILGTGSTRALAIKVPPRSRTAGPIIEGCKAYLVSSRCSSVSCVSDTSFSGISAASLLRMASAVAASSSKLAIRIWAMFSVSR